VRDADPAFWLTRLDALRLANRADQFDEAAIDYCVTYEVSPAVLGAHALQGAHQRLGESTRTPPQSVVSDRVHTGFMESSLHRRPGQRVEGGARRAVGPAGGRHQRHVDQAARRRAGHCAHRQRVVHRLIRVDFIAAGDLLNWVLARRNENRAVHFVDAHRLVALFFGAMGINEHAKVQVRKNWLPPDGGSCSGLAEPVPRRP
jgi:hypothetical protein